MSLVVVSADQFIKMQTQETLELNTPDRKKLKETLLDRIKELVPVRWNRAKKMQQVIDTIVYFATDRGYSFFGRETLAKRCEVSLRTVDAAIKKMKESGEVVVVYRENPNSNGYKTPVILFKQHPNFDRLSDILKLDCKVDCSVEDSSNASQDKDQGAKNIPTYSFTTNLYLNNHLMSKKYIKYVPKSINKSFYFLGDNLLSYWKRVLLACKVVNKRYGIEISKDEKESIGYVAINALKTYIKDGMGDLEEQMKLVYKITLKQLEQSLERKQNDFNDRKEVTPVSQKKIVRYEKLPDWLDKPYQDPVLTEEDIARMARLEKIQEKYRLQTTCD